MALSVFTYIDFGGTKPMPKRPWTTPTLRGPFPLASAKPRWTKPVIEVRDITATESGAPHPYPDSEESLS